MDKEWGERSKRSIVLRRVITVTASCARQDALQGASSCYGASSSTHISHSIYGSSCNYKTLHDQLSFMHSARGFIIANWNCTIFAFSEDWPCVYWKNFLYAAFSFCACSAAFLFAAPSSLVMAASPGANLCAVSKLFTASSSSLRPKRARAFR